MRKRLTARGLTAEKRSDGLYPGDIGNPDAQKVYRDADEYSNYDWQEGWDTPSDNKIEDKYDKVGFGVPKKVQAFRTAKKASVLASLMLGDEVSDKILQAQAKDLMKLGYSSICAAIRRMQAANDMMEKAALEEEKKAEAPASTEACATPPVAAEEVKASEEVKAGAEEVKAEEPAPAEAPAPAPEDVSELTETAPAEEEEPPMNIEIPDAAPEAVAEGVFDPEKQLNIAEADPELERLFRNEEEPAEEEAPAAPTACTRPVAKQGIKHIATQPKLASSQANEVEELSHIWDHLAHPHL